MSASSRFTPSDFLQLAAWQSAAGDGPVLRGRRHDGPPLTLHFLHGNGFCGGVYWPLLRHFVADYGLFCHDLEGHGASDAASRFSGTPRIAARIPQIIADQGLQAGQLIGIGHSYGAAQTVQVAAAHPELFRALVLLDPILLPNRFYLATRIAAALRRNPLSRAARRRRDRWVSRQAAWDRLHDRGIYQDWTDEAFGCFIDHATRDEPMPGGGVERVLCCPKWLEAEIFDHPVYPWPALRRLRCPVLFVHGDASYPFMPMAAHKARRLLPSLQLEIVHGGHCFMQEDPATTAALALAFLRRHGL
ncbi:alpha/beta fold hydrolase [Solimonas soli]|uniref:alpha/beta fold hydrolase n=1 Tax=Solimonas soli TaxID=413479 RepID=UPI0006856498|nr:alpha/beta hydrolase [Solimonas soli]